MSDALTVRPGEMVGERPEDAQTVRPGHKVTYHDVEPRFDGRVIALELLVGTDLSADELAKLLSPLVRGPREDAVVIRGRTLNVETWRLVDDQPSEYVMCFRMTLYINTDRDEVELAQKIIEAIPGRTLVLGLTANAEAAEMWAELCGTVASIPNTKYLEDL
jgi:hypothetical protein